MSAARRLKGYAMVGGSAVMFGATGVWVGMTDLPASTVLSMRMALAAVMVALLGGAARWARQARRPGVWRRLLALGLLDALQLYTFMLALRHLDVALAVFLSYLSPIYIALVAPRSLRQRTEPVVIAALVLAVTGIIVMLAPGLLDPALRVSAFGVAAGLVSGLLLAAFFLVAKTLSDVDGSTMLISNGVIVAVVMLPLGLVQWAGVGFAFVLTDFWAVLGLAVFSTALGGTVFLHGVRYIPCSTPRSSGSSSRPARRCSRSSSWPSGRRSGLCSAAPSSSSAPCWWCCSARRKKASPDRRRRPWVRPGPRHEAPPAPPREAGRRQALLDILAVPGLSLVPSRTRAACQRAAYPVRSDGGPTANAAAGTHGSGRPSPRAAQAREGARRDHPPHLQPTLAGPGVRPGPRTRLP